MAEMEVDVGETKRCFVKIEPIRDLEKFSKVEVPLKSQKYSRKEKILMLPKKKSKSGAVKTGKITKQKKTKKSQLKITSFFSNNGEKEDRASPVDSGFSSRQGTPEDDDDISDTDLPSQDTEDVKKSFLASIEDDLDSDSDKDESEEEESDWEDEKETNWKPKKQTKRVSKASTMVVIQQTEKSELELQREKSMKEADELFKALKSQWENYKTKNMTTPKPRTFTPRVKTEFTGELRRSGRKTGERVMYTVDDEIPKCRAVRIKYEFDEQGRYVQKEKKWTSRSDIDPNTNVLQPEDVTESMLKMIHFSGKKTYSSDRGTCCHQCRQKTIDTKTVCRSGHCIGLRGQFCGSCLNNRYGESVKECLLDPEWECPPCRRICNCSFCLEVPTGQLYSLARSLGYKSVHHYLVYLREKWDNESEDKEAD